MKILKVEELRIGNLIQDEEGQIGSADDLKSHEFANFDAGCINLEGKCNLIIRIKNDFYTPEHVYGIPLTEQWLLKFGFVKGIHKNATMPYIIRNVWTFRIDYSVPQKQWFYLNHPDIHAEIQYVHQLQNLYFALTGEELTPSSTPQSNKEND